MKMTSLEQPSSEQPSSEQPSSEQTSPRLLMLFPSTRRGGVEEYNLVAAKGARQRGWEVHAAFPRTDGTASLIRDFARGDIAYHALAIAEEANWLPSVARHLPRLLKTLRLLIALKPDVVQITLPAPDYCLGSIMACALLQVPTVVRFGLVLPLATAINQWRIRAYRWARGRRQQWVAISQNNRRLLSELFEIPEREIACIYNGAKPATSLLLGDRQIADLRRQVRRELQLPENTQLLLTVGRLNFQKGHRDLIPAIPHIVRERADVRFVWVGDGELRADLEAQLKAYQIADRVLLLGYRSDVLRLLQAADLFVFPTHFEGGQSFAIAEAMACGLPVVTSDASGIPEIIHHRVHGLLFRKGDSCELLEFLRWAIAHPREMQAMADSARARARDFTEEKMIGNYAALWRSLCRSPHALPCDDVAVQSVAARGVPAREAPARDVPARGAPACLDTDPA